MRRGRKAADLCRVCKKLLIFLIVTASIVFCQEAKAQTETLSGQAEDETGKLLGELDLEEVQQAVDELLQDHSISVQEMIKRLMSGEMTWNKETMAAFLREIFTEQFAREKTILLQILLLILVAAVFTNFTNMFENGQIGEICFYVIYLLLFVLLMESFQEMSSQLEKSLRAVAAFMRQPIFSLWPPQTGSPQRQFFTRWFF